MKENELLVFCKEWLAAWTGNQPKKLRQFYSEEAYYRDPVKKSGLRGSQILPYFEKLLARNPDWVWETIEVLPTAKGFYLKWKATIPTDGKVVHETGFDIVELDGAKITRNEVFFDRPLSKAFNLNNTYAQLKADGGATLQEADTFWQAVQAGDPVVDNENFGFLVCSFEYESDWPHWEMHPAGDEIVSLLSGEVDLILEIQGAEQILKLKTGETCVVPRGVWHRAAVHKPSKALHVTPGAGTVHRAIKSSR